MFTLAVLLSESRKLMSQTRSASEETDFGMNGKMVLFSAFLAIIIDFSAKVHQGYANLWQRFGKMRF